MDVNKLYSVQYFDHKSGSCLIVGLFRDEYTATMFRDNKNKELKEHKKDDQTGYYVIHPLYTDF